MQINIKNKIYSIKFRKWSYCREFYFHWIDHLSIWCFRKWKNNCCDVWISTGFRILGVEFNCREYILNRG